MMWFYKKLLIYRLYIGAVLLVLSVVLAVIGNNWGWFSLTLFLALLAIISHFLFGPLRLVQEAIEKGDMVAAKKYLDMVQFPKLLIKPVRQGYYLVKSNLAMTSKDYAGAEEYLKESLKSKNSLAGKEFEGSSYLQLGMLAAQKGDNKEAKKNLRTAIAKGLPDDDTMASAFLQLASIEISSRQFKIGRDYFRKAKSLKPKTKEVKDQISQMEKYISRIR
jgi:tetratricopeptide (TPR) repeat protein